VCFPALCCVSCILKCLTKRWLRHPPITGQRKGIKGFALQESAVGDIQKCPRTMSGRGKGGKGLEELMLSAARSGWSGIPVWASEEDVQAVRDRHPEVFGRRTRSPSPPLVPFGRGRRLSGDAIAGSPVDAPGAASSSRLSGDALCCSPSDAPLAVRRLSGDALQGSPADAPLEEDDDNKTAVEGWQDFEEE
jgi:hypothetical protein